MIPEGLQAVGEIVLGESEAFKFKIICGIEMQSHRYGGINPLHLENTLISKTNLT